MGDAGSQMGCAADYKYFLTRLTSDPSEPLWHLVSALAVRMVCRERKPCMYSLAKVVFMQGACCGSVKKMPAERSCLQ